MKNYIKNTVEKDNIKTKTKSKSMNINSALINKENIRSNIDLNYPKNISTKIAPISM